MTTADKKTWHKAYGDYRAAIDRGGLATIQDPRGRPLLQFRVAGVKDAATRKTATVNVLKALASRGLHGLATHYKARVIAQVPDGGANDMQGFSDPSMFGAVVEGGNVDMRGVDRATHPKRTVDDASTDMQLDRQTPPNSTLDGGESDHDQRPEGAPPAAGEDHPTMSDKRNPPPKTTLEGGVNDRRAAAEKRQALFRVQARVAHGTQPNKAYTVTKIITATRGQARVAQEVHVQPEGEDKTYRVSARDFLAQWQALDSAAPGMPPPEWRPTSQPRAAAAPSADGLNERQARLYRTKVAQVEAQIEERAAALAEAKQAELVRALFVVAARQDRDLADAPLRGMMMDALTTPHEVGVGYDGETLRFAGLASDLAEHLVRKAWNAGNWRHVEALVQSAAEFAQRGEHYLLDAERDLSRMPLVAPPRVVSAASLPDNTHVNQAAMRAQASAGSFAFTNPAPMEHPSAQFAPPGPGGLQGVIRQAMSGSTVGAIHADLMGLR